MDILVILLLILFNGFFSMAEIALISSRKSRLKQMAKEGSIKAEQALQLSEKPSNFLSTVQIGITFISIMAGAIGEGRLVTDLSAKLPFLGSATYAVSFIIVVLCITYATIVIGELVPKQIALSNPEKVAALTAPLMSFISAVASPVIHVFSSSTEFVFKALRLRTIKNPAITEDEVRILIREGTDMGIFTKTEKKLVERALRLDDLQVKALMRPRTQIQFFPLKEFEKDPLKFLIDYNHTRVLLSKGGVDKITAVVHVKDVLTYLLRSDRRDFKKYLSKPLVVPHSTRALKVLEMFRHSPIHVALVIDEFGTVQGIITLNDVLQALVGEIKNGNDEVENNSSYIVRPDGSLLIDGMYPIPDAKKLLHVDQFPKEDLNIYQTLGGFVISYLEKIPKLGERFTWGVHTFEIVDLDENRVDKILISKIKK